jgi:hypothetical protein
MFLVGRKAIMEIPEENGKPPRAEEPDPEKALVEALRGFIRQAPRQPEPASAVSVKIGLWQALTLVFFAVDLALIYSLFERWLQTPLPQYFLKVVPWVLGAAAVGFADKVRQSLVDHASHLKWAIPAAALPVFLLIPLMPVFSARVRMSPETAKIEPFEIKDGCVDVKLTPGDPSAARLAFPALQACRVRVSDSRAESGDTAAFMPTLGRRSILRATLAQVPLLGRMFGEPEIKLAPLYRAKFRSPKKSNLLVSGQFSNEFLGSVTKCTRDSKQKVSTWICTVLEGTDSVLLPSGAYDFTLVQPDECRRALKNQYVNAGENELIDFTRVACSK